MDYFDSKVELFVLTEFPKRLNTGDKTFIEYTLDYETRRGLELSFPPVVTRLGYILFNKVSLGLKTGILLRGLWRVDPNYRVRNR